MTTNSTHVHEHSCAFCLARMRDTRRQERRRRRRNRQSSEGLIYLRASRADLPATHVRRSFPRGARVSPSRLPACSTDPSDPHTHTHTQLRPSSLPGSLDLLTHTTTHGKQDRQAGFWRAQASVSKLVRLGARRIAETAFLCVCVGEWSTTLYCPRLFVQISRAVRDSKRRIYIRLFHVIIRQYSRLHS